MLPSKQQRRGYTGLQLAVGLVIVLAICAIIGYAAPAMGIAIPDFVIKVAWVVAVAVIAIGAIVGLYKFWKSIG